MISQENILITGAAGFIGANLTHKLVSLKNKVHIFVKPTTNLWRLKNVLPFIKLYNVQLTNKAQLRKIIKRIKPGIIYHLATYGAYPAQADQISIINTNIMGTANLITALNSGSYECFINTGSSSEYGFKRKPMKETDLLKPESFYAATKAVSSYYCQIIAKGYNKPIATIRPFSVYGPYEEAGRFIPTVITNTLLGKSVYLTPGSIRRDFIYINDLIDAYLKIALSIKNRKNYGEIFNIGSGKQYTNNQVVNIIAKIINKKISVIKGGYQKRNWDTDFWVADITKAKKQLNWKPKYPLKSGLRETINWFKKYEGFTAVYNQNN